MALVFAAWTTFALLSTTHFALGKQAAGDFNATRDVASHILLFYWAWAIVTPFVARVTHTIGAAVRGDSSRAPIAVLRLAMAAVIALPAHALFYLIAVRFTGLEPGVRFTAAQFGDYLMRHAGGDLATLVAIVGIVLFIDAQRHARTRELAASEVAARLARADAELPRWQLQPHFLFNTLNTVSTLVLKGDIDGADRAIQLIARWLRAALGQRVDTRITLGDELATIEQYVAIESLRFGNTLRLRIDANDDARGARIPSLLVQPLVENAIQHGGPFDDSVASEIVVVAKRDESLLNIKVYNPIPGNAEAAREGFGLRYVRERLMQEFRSEGRVALTTEGGEAIATLEIPL
jgi:hypothetical protein